MAGFINAMVASWEELTDEEFQEMLPYVIREVEEMGGHAYQGANAIGDLKLSATYIKAAREGLIEIIESTGFFHDLGQLLKIKPVSQLTPKGRELYEQYKAQESEGELEPNRYGFSLSG